MENRTKQCWARYLIQIVLNFSLYLFKKILGQYFVTAGDITRFSETKVDKITLNIITILRHLKRLKESRIGTVVYYAPY